MQPACLCFTDGFLLFKCRPLSFDNGWMDVNADCRVNAVDKKFPMAKNLVNFGQATLP